MIRELHFGAHSVQFPLCGTIHIILISFSGVIQSNQHR